MPAWEELKSKLSRMKGRIGVQENLPIPRAKATAQMPAIANLI